LCYAHLDSNKATMSLWCAYNFFFFRSWVNCLLVFLYKFDLSKKKYYSLSFLYLKSY
jgi:hypothetical protein